jgi:hypothetical protein
MWTVEADLDKEFLRAAIHCFHGKEESVVNRLEV